MYLCDRHIRALLDQLNVTTEEGMAAFDPVSQVQPASLDLRLSAVFWQPLRRFPMDLRRAKLLEIQPRRYYRRLDLKPSNAIKLKPGELILGRTAEEFTIPNGYAAELVGRSSFSRLGLMITAAGGFINPGWRGRMPLQIVNFSPNTVRLFPGLPIGQIRIVKLTDLSAVPYGGPGLNSKYMNDDGGPSYWWRDKRITLLHNALSERTAEAQVQRDIDAAVGMAEPEILERLERFVARQRVEDLQSADILLDRFAEAEDTRQTWRRWGLNIARGLFVVGLSISLWVYNKPPFHWWHWAIWETSVGLLGLGLYAHRTEVGDHFGHKELRTQRNKLASS